MGGSPAAQEGENAEHVGKQGEKRANSSLSLSLSWSFFLSLPHFPTSNSLLYIVKESRNVVLVLFLFFHHEDKKTHRGTAQQIDNIPDQCAKTIVCRNLKGNNPFCFCVCLCLSQQFLKHENGRYVVTKEKQFFFLHTFAPFCRFYQKLIKYTHS